MTRWSFKHLNFFVMNGKFKLLEKTPHFGSYIFFAMSLLNVHDHYFSQICLNIFIFSRKSTFTLIKESFCTFTKISKFNKFFTFTSNFFWTNIIFVEYSNRKTLQKTTEKNHITFADDNLLIFSFGSNDLINLKIFILP